MNREQCDVVVVGAGISGLSAAHWISRKGMDVRVLEKDAVVGGTMKSHREEGYLVELGPNSGLETTPLIRELVTDLDIGRAFVYASPVGRNRYILRENRLHALPMNPVALLQTGLFSGRAKLRLLREPFIGRSVREETVAEFVSRRLGPEFLDYAVDPFVAGVYAARPDQLSVRSAFPKLYALEERYGGLIKGMIQGRRERKARAEKARDRAETFSFLEGMHSLPLAISSLLGNRVTTEANVTSIDDLTVEGKIAGDEPASRRFAVEYLLRGVNHRLEADTVVLAIPAFAAAPLVSHFSGSLGRLLEAITYPPVVSVFLGYHERNLHRPLDGFGFLVPSRENRKILGCLWTSSLFPNRAPREHVALTVFVGGSRQPELTAAADAELLELVVRELASAMQIEGNPVYFKVTRWPRAIPQYVLGYHRTTDAIAAFEEEHPGLFFCSNYRGGISVGDCVMSAHVTAESVAAEISSIR